MDKVENKYLHSISIDKLKKETGLAIKQIADLADIGERVVYKWAYNHKDSSRPSYDAFVRLFEAGATVETLFGVEYKAGIKIIEKPIKVTDADISALLHRAADALEKNSQ